MNANAQGESTDTLIKAGGTVFFAACLWFGYELNASTHLAVSHLASVLFLAFSVGVVLIRRTIAWRRPWGTNTQLILIVSFSLYIIARLLQSIHNDFFWGQALKLALIAVVFWSYKTLDPSGRALKFWLFAMPALLAGCILFGLVMSAFSGTLLVERLRVGPNDYEYVAEYSCHMLPLILYSLESAQSKTLKVCGIAVAITLLAGLAFAGSRASVAGGLIAISTYGFLARRRLGRKLIGAVGAILLLSILGTSIIGAQRSDIASGSLDDQTGLNQLTSGRFANWAFEFEQVTQDNKTVLFGTGLGRYAEWVPEDGGFYRTAIVNSLLAAWTPFGLIGLAAYLFLYYYLWNRISAIPRGRFRCMVVSLFLAFVFTDQFETHWQGTKMLWFVSFVLYLFTLARPPLPDIVRKYRLLPRPRKPIFSYARKLDEQPT